MPSYFAGHVLLGILAFVEITTSAHGQRQLTVRETGRGSCALRIEKILTLGEGDTASRLSPFTAIKQDGRGRYFATSISMNRIIVFDSLGHFQGKLGKPDQDTSQFALITRIVIGPDDSLYVIDQTQRLTVVGPEGAVARTVRLPAEPRSLVMLANGNAVISASVGTEERAGWPAHSVSPAGEIVESFGSHAPELRPGHESETQRIVAAAREQNAVWLAFTNRYRIEQWTPDGTHSLTLLRTPAWFQPWSKSRRRPYDVEGPPPAVRGVRQDASGKLWVLISVPGRDWHSRKVGAEQPGPVLSDFRMYFDSIVEVLDPATGRILASLRSPEAFTGFVADGLLATKRDVPGRAAYVDIWRVQLQTIPSGDFQHVNH